MKTRPVRLHPLSLSLVLLSLPTAALAAPPACTCKDLPAMVKEIIEQEYLGDKFRQWSEYLPIGLTTPGRVQAKAQAEFNAQFYPKGAGASAAGTQDGGHAALGTNYQSEGCDIGVYQYDKNGKPLNKEGKQIVPLDDAGKPEGGRKPPKDNEHYLKPMTEEQYMKSGKQCEALMRYPWIHEQHHQNTCKTLKAEGREKAWDSMTFFTRNDAESYKAGADYLRAQTRKLALSCGWEGSTGENAVPPPERAKELASKGARISKSRGGKKKSGSQGNGAAKIIMGVAIEILPMRDLLDRWDAQCADEGQPGCDALGASIEIGMIDLLQSLRYRGGGVDRETLFDAAHADSPQLKQFAMRQLYNAQTPEETEFALRMTEHASPGVREAARAMLQGSDDPRWRQIERLWQRARDGGGELVPDQPPRAEVLGVDTLAGLRHLPYGTSETQTLFVSSEAPEAVLKRVFKGKQVMTNASDVEAAGKDMEAAMMGMQQEMMRAAQSGDMKKMTELTNRLMEMQQKMMPSDPMAVNSEKGSIGILLEKDAATNMPVRVARIRRDETSGQTLVIFERARKN